MMRPKMNNELARKIIRKQLDEILLEAPIDAGKFQAGRKESGKISVFKLKLSRFQLNR